MRQNAMRARPKRRGKPKDDGERSIIAHTILDRTCDADRPNQAWLADLAYIWTARGWLYVAVVLDLFSRRVVGPPLGDCVAITCRSAGSMKADRDAALVMDALIPLGTLHSQCPAGRGMAVWRRGQSDALLPPSDRGSHHTGERFQRLLRDTCMTCSPLGSRLRIACRAMG